MQVYARASLAAGRQQSTPALLLEGSWPTGAGVGQFSLDELIGPEYAYLDNEASALAERLGATDVGTGQLSLAWLDALRLRYFLVKLLRVAVAFTDDCFAWKRASTIVLHVERGRDDSYAELFASIASTTGVEIQFESHRGTAPTKTAPPQNSLWRRILARVVAPALSRRGKDAPRFAFAGNPQVLKPIAAELVGRGAKVAWLYDRLAVRELLSGQQQFLYEAHRGGQNRCSPDVPAITWRGVELANALRPWWHERLAYGGRWSRVVDRATEHLRRFRPRWLVLDEDATPHARAAIHAARELNIPTAVVQHGAPYVQFGFAPSIAQRHFVWGETSRQRLIDWGLPAESIAVSGSPRHDELLRTLPAKPRPLDPHGPMHILLLATVPPRDDRPDSIAFRLTTATHAELLNAAFSSVAKLPGDVQLVVKLHPRCRDTASFEPVWRRYPHLRVKFVHCGDLIELVQQSACVLSLASSSGIEAALTRVPVIHLVPRGSSETLDARWGFFGTASDASQLDELLPPAIIARHAGTVPAPRCEVFANLERSAAEAVADHLLPETQAGPEQLPHVLSATNP